MRNKDPFQLFPSNHILIVTWGYFHLCRALKTFRYAIRAEDLKKKKKKKRAKVHKFYC